MDGYDYPDSQIHRDFLDSRTLASIQFNELNRRLDKIELMILSLSRCGNAEILPNEQITE
tara:strand:- start:44 stop:223 length:180 start_codon:yes stop_codon:yes gene_type:complete